MFSDLPSHTLSTWSPVTADREAQGMLGNNVTRGGRNTSVVSDLGVSDLLFYHFFINVYVDGALCVLGYVGNVLVIVVLQRDKVRTSNMVFLQALAVFDSLFLTYVMLYVVLRSIPPYTGQLQGYADINPYIVFLVLPIGWTSQTCTIWIVMIIAIDRYLVVSRPLKAQLWCTTRNARWVVVGMFVVAILFNAPRWPHYHHVAFGAPVAAAGSDTTFVSHLAYTASFWDENLYRMVYHQVLGFIFLFIIPLSVIITLNVLLVFTINQAVRRRRTMTSPQRAILQSKPTQSEETRHGSGSKPPPQSESNAITSPQRATPQPQSEKMHHSSGSKPSPNTWHGSGSKAPGQQSDSNMNLNIMLVIMITIFVVCELPDFIASIIGAANTRVDPALYQYYAVVKEFLLVFNSAANFYIYCVFYKRFRSTLGAMLGCGPPRLQATVPAARSRVVMNGGRSLSDVRSVGSQQTLNSSLNGSALNISTLSLTVATEDVRTKL